MYVGVEWADGIKVELMIPCAGDEKTRLLSDYHKSVTGGTLASHIQAVRRKS